MAAPAVARIAWGNAPKVTLKLHHFLSAVSSAHAKFLSPWARKVEAESAGRIRIDIFPSMQLGGAPAQLYDQVRDGAADIVWALPSNTPGRFPRTEVFELPFVPSSRAWVNSKALEAYAAAHLRDEFREVHPICFWCQDCGLLHANRSVKAVEDLKGLKLRFPTPLAGDALRALGAKPIVVPISQLRWALVRRVVDGCLVPWEATPALKLREVLKFHTEIAGSPALSTTAFVLAMNRRAYARLPADLKQVIDDNSGQAAAGMAGAMLDAESAAAAEDARERGNTVITLAPEEAARWRKATEPVIESWLKHMKERRIDGHKLLADARSLLAKYEQEPQPVRKDPPKPDKPSPQVSERPTAKLDGDSGAKVDDAPKAPSPPPAAKPAPPAPAAPPPILDVLQIPL
jgi:TRAP-type C4-dicarboxylate transport system substrate-binding protein